MIASAGHAARILAAIACVTMLGACGAPVPQPGEQVESPVTMIPLPDLPQILPRMDCAQLAAMDFTRNAAARTAIESATIEPATAGRAEFCLVKGRVAPQIGFELRLPTSGYTGRYLQGGCGGNCGSIGSSLAPACTNQHAYSGAFAVGFNDAGHSGAALDALWATNRGLLEDFAHRGPYAASVAAKAIVTAFYGEAPRHSYFDGCSNGGREALQMVQRYPEAFDGVIAGASAYTMLEKVERYLWENKYGFDGQGELVFTPQAGELLHRAVMESCDGKDGLVDGQIDDPRRCDYDPARLQCQSGESGSDCLTAMQVQTARAFYDGPRTADGKRLFQGGEPYGAELTWGTRSAFAYAGRPAAEGFVRYFLPDGAAIPDFRAEEWEFTAESLRRLQSADRLLDARNADLAAFRAAGGKLIMWQGAADYAAGPRAIFEYYHALRALSGGTAKAREFARLFLIPGVYHCRGGYVPYEEDLLGAMVAWVETGAAPDSVEAAAILEDGTLRRRPVHAYPTVTRYSGSGDINDAASFVGVEPDSPPDDRWDWLGTFTADLPPS